MLNIQFKPNETLFKEMLEHFNNLLEHYYPDILEFSHIDLYNYTNFATPEDWREFKLDPRVYEWYKKEMTLIANQKLFSLLNNIDKTNSTASSQSLGQLLNFLKQQEENKENNKFFIYSFIPLTPNEKEAPNVKILEAIPSELSDSIQTFNHSSN